MKEFLKPTIWKIILTIIIFSLLPVKLWTGIVCELCLSSQECSPCPTTFYGPLFRGLDLVLYNIRESGFVVVVWLIFNFVISYIISCLIIFIYKKIRGKKKR